MPSDSRALIAAIAEERRLERLTATAWIAVKAAERALVAARHKRRWWVDKVENTPVKPRGRN